MQHIADNDKTMNFKQYKHFNKQKETKIIIYYKSAIRLWPST